MRKVQVRYLINLERLRLGDLKGKRPEGAGLFPTVHDELIVELSLKDTGTVKKLLEVVMLAKKARFPFTLPSSLMWRRISVKTGRRSDKNRVEYRTGLRGPTDCCPGSHLHTGNHL